MSVLIIGSGIGGATAAFALAKRGIEVTVIERGAHLAVEHLVNACLGELVQHLEQGSGVQALARP